MTTKCDLCGFQLGRWRHVPVRDLNLSPDHAVFVNGVWVSEDF